ncbi:MAG: Kazal-type serine protease inhibitor domain-containing protein [Flavobacteriaceae bacterium]
MEIYQPVCGCDNKTYSNTCFAGINGLKSWTEGACK